MPEGFVGAPAHTYLLDITTSMEEANTVHNKDPFQNLTNRTVLPRVLHSPVNCVAPYTEETAMSGGYSTGYGTSENIVVSPEDYEEILKAINETDDRICEVFHRIAREIDEICSTSYKLPGTVQKCNSIITSITTSMGNFRALTESTINYTNRFVEETLSIR